MLYQPPSQEGDEPTYNITVWIKPTNQTFHLSVDFYLSSSDVGNLDLRQGGITFRVEVLDNPRNDAQLYRLPANLDMVWVEVYVDQNAKATSSLNIDERTTFAIPGHLVDILLVPWIGQ